MNRGPVDFTDPATVKRRLFIGNVIKSDDVYGDLMGRFERYGKIEGLQLNRGFGFVQFEEEEAAKEVLKFENGIVIQGKKIELKAARVGGRGPGGVPLHQMDSESPQAPPAKRLDSGPPARGRGRGGGRGGETAGMERGGGRKAGRGRAPATRGLPAARGREIEMSPGKEMTMPAYRERSPLREWDYRERERMEARSPAYWDAIRDGRGGRYPTDPYRERAWADYARGYRGDAYNDYYAQHERYADVLESPRPNTVEIVVMNKTQRAYAEFVEGRVKRMGLTVDILFPKEKVTLEDAIERIASRGILFAIVVKPEHESCKSVTVDVLIGRQPEEHRNVPVEAAMQFLSRTYEAYNQSLRDKTPFVVPKLADIIREVEGTAPVQSTPTTVGAPGAIPLAPPAPTISAQEAQSKEGAHPEKIQQLLMFLLENRPLTVMEYDRIIQYLQEKRQGQLLVEPDARKSLDFVEPVAETDDLVIAKAQTEQQVLLTRRILNILNNTQLTSVAPTGTTDTAPMSVLPSTSLDSKVVSAVSPTQAHARAPQPASTVSSPMVSTAPSNWGASMGNPSSNQNHNSGANSTRSPGAMSSLSAPILENPSVQKALDSLIQTGPNFLKALANPSPVDQGNMQGGSPVARNPGGFGAYGNYQQKY